MQLQSLAVRRSKLCGLILLRSILSLMLLTSNGCNNAAMIYMEFQSPTPLITDVRYQS
jgi:hypothetical protein